MTKAHISKSVRFSTELYDKIETAMKHEGSEDFSEFVRRAVSAELRLSELRDQNLQQIAEEQAPYNKPLKPNGGSKKAS